MSWPLCRPCSELICPRNRKSSWLPWKALHKNGSEKSTFNEDNSDRTVHNLYPIKSQRRGSPSRNLVSRMSLLFPPLMNKVSHFLAPHFEPSSAPYTNDTFFMFWLAFETINLVLVPWHSVEMPVLMTSWISMDGVIILLLLFREVLG